MSIIEFFPERQVAPFNPAIIGGSAERQYDEGYVTVGTSITMTATELTKF